MELTNDTKQDLEFDELEFEIASLEHAIDMNSRQVVQAQKRRWQLCEETWGHDYEAEDNYMRCVTCGAWNTEIDDDPEEDRA